MRVVIDPERERSLVFARLDDLGETSTRDKDLMSPAEVRSAVSTFVRIASGRNFIAFSELEEVLSMSVAEIVALKADCQSALRKQDRGINLTSRIDLDPPGFEIEH